MSSDERPDGSAPDGGQGASAQISLVASVFAHLSDGQFHSGEDLASALGVSRSAVWKAVKSLRELGATLHAVRNRGYRLAKSSEPLDASLIGERLSAPVRGRLRSLDVVWSVDSTNTTLFSRPFPPNGSTEVMLAEYQTAGRGRRGRAWLAPPGGAICLSLSWTFRDVPEDLGALGLVIGVCELRALRELGILDAKLKWPNDVLVEGRKLGGILIELRAESGGWSGLRGDRHRTQCCIGGAVACENRRNRDRGDRSGDGRLGRACAQHRGCRVSGFLCSWPAGF